MFSIKLAPAVCVAASLMKGKGGQKLLEFGFAANANEAGWHSFDEFKANPDLIRAGWLAAAREDARRTLADLRKIPRVVSPVPRVEMPSIFFRCLPLVLSSKFWIESRIRNRLACGMHFKHTRAARGFTLLELMVVIGIIALLAALVLSNIDFGSKMAKRRVTERSIVAIESALEGYLDKFGEYPTPANPDETAEIMLGKSYRVGGAKCLYQALRGDGYDALQLEASATPTVTAASDGDFSRDELPRVILRDLPPNLWRKVGSHYFLVDGFAQPFQYAKAVDGDKETVNSTYDLWSFTTDESNRMAKSKDTQSNAALGAKWVKNW